MKLKDIKRKDGKGLLPEKEKMMSEVFPNIPLQVKNKVLSEMGEIELFDYIEIDVGKASIVLYEYLKHTKLGDMLNGRVDCIPLAQALAKADIIGGKGE